MKALLLTLVTFAAFNSQASFTPFPHLFTANILKIDRLEGNEFPNSTIGTIQINKTMKTASLVVYTNKECPKDQFCTLEISGDLIELPIVKVIHGYCGEVTYIAEEDKRPVDGLYQGLLITDNSKNKCGFNDQTFVQLTKVWPGRGFTQGQTITIFTAEKFVEAMPY
jgi:hypothetical protein